VEASNNNTQTEEIVMSEVTKLRGKVKWFNAAKGFGFVIPDQPLAGKSKPEDIFIHHSNIDMPGYRTLNEGQEVEFEMGDGRGGQQAIAVTPVGEVK
jgi:CspA family cold shock protein